MWKYLFILYCSIRYEITFPTRVNKSCINYKRNKDYKLYMYICIYIYFFLVSFLAALVAYGSSRARDRVWARVAIHAIAVATLDPYPTAPGWGANLHCHRDNDGSLTCCTRVGTHKVYIFLVRIYLCYWCFFLYSFAKPWSLVSVYIFLCTLIYQLQWLRRN